MARNDYALLIDLDGVLYQENELIAGAPETVAWIESQEIDYLFITNTTSKSRAALVKKCARMDLKVDSSRIITPIVAAARWLKVQSIHSAAMFVKAGAIEDFVLETEASIIARFPSRDHDGRTALALGYGSLYNHRYDPNATTIEAMKEARRGGLKSFASVEDLMADLNADD